MMYNCTIIEPEIIDRDHMFGFLNVDNPALVYNDNSRNVRINLPIDGGALRFSSNGAGIWIQLVKAVPYALRIWSISHLVINIFHNFRIILMEEFRDLDYR